jgi:hypothetical protein
LAAKIGAVETPNKKTPNRIPKETAGLKDQAGVVKRLSLY